MPGIACAKIPAIIHISWPDSKVVCRVSFVLEHTFPEACQIQLIIEAVGRVVPEMEAVVEGTVEDSAGGY